MNTNASRGIRSIITGFLFAMLLSMSPQLHSLAADPPQSLIQAAPARIEMFLFVDGIKGSSTDVGHKDWIDCLSFGQAAGSALASCSAGLTAPVTFSEFTVSKHLDKATPLLETSMLTGKLIKTVTLEVTDGGKVFYRIELRDVLIASMSSNGVAGNEPPTENVNLSFQQITWQVLAINPDSDQPGSLSTGGWDVCANTPVATQ
jgi:type VI secretion system Hcp family effector